MHLITLNGTIRRVFDATINKGFEKRIFILAEPDRIKNGNTWSLELQQNDANLTDNFKPGDCVECVVDIKGREFKNSQGVPVVINTMRCIKITRVEDVSKPAAVSPQQALPGLDAGNG